jgi:hypothetical protein
MASPGSWRSAAAVLAARPCCSATAAGEEWRRGPPRDPEGSAFAPIPLPAPRQLAVKLTNFRGLEWEIGISYRRPRPASRTGGEGLKAAAGESGTGGAERRRRDGNFFFCLFGGLQRFSPVFNYEDLLSGLLSHNGTPYCKKKNGTPFACLRYISFCYSLSFFCGVC